MPYTEFHFNTDTSVRNPQSTRNRPSYDLREAIEPKNIALKDLTLPLTWCNLNNGAGGINLSDNASPANYYALTFAVPVGCYDGVEFTLALQTAIRNPISSTYFVNGIPTAPVDVLDLTQISCVLNTDGYVVFTILPDVFNVSVFLEGEIYWSADLAKIFNRPYTDIDIPLTIPVSTPTPTFYPLRLVPTHVYFHSNMMASCSHNAGSLRPHGSHTSRTILSKIMIDSSFVFGSQIQPYRNESLHPEFMYETFGKFNSLEFWFTDEEGTMLDFRNVGFSFTIAMVL